MTVKDMIELKEEYGEELEISNAIHFHDEDAWNKYTISYKGIIVGSELVSKYFVRDYINTHFE